MRGIRRGQLRTALAPLVLPAGVGLVTTALYTVFSALQWRSFAAPSWDLGIFTQLARQYAALQAPIVTIKGDGFNLLGDHFHPLLVLLAPVFAVFPHAFTLLVVQNALFGLAAAALTYAAVRLLGRLTGTLFGLAFAFSWGLQGAVEAQFHEIAFAVPLLALSLTAFLGRQWVACLLWAMPLVFVKEDLGLTVAALGIVLAVRSRHPLGVWLAVWGVGWFALASLVILPLLNPNGAWAYASSIDPLRILQDPAALFQPQKSVTVLLLLVAGGLIAVRSPLALVLLPTLAWRFLSDNSGYWGPTWQYSAVLMPILFAAALDGIALALGSLQGWMRRYGRLAASVSIVAALVLATTLPLFKLADVPAHFSTHRAAAATAALRGVPDGALVESDIGLMNYLVERTDVYWLGNENPLPDYLVIDLAAGGLPAEWTSVQVVAQALHPGVEFTTIHAAGGYEVARRDAAAP
ncbi:DUF2079 domain-containing protein [Cryobacterium sp. PH31-L1]|uniref:DUF2079 domain-containing protein n=1 Tax=Cryobacterium sp. PH31-L1 TaxID=3046199 RepID=UPI0024BB7E86|nr:DUF2079 domain-containing protein [Cryobacterium sp. PH31-L1]MDJ0377894.1 DUF2079 domain-containing protein [Cryobacterium sp. PH31-L1]